MGDNVATANISILRSSGWPYNVIYFVAELMEAEGALTLLACDAEFHEPDSKVRESLTAVDITRAGARSYPLSASEDHFDAKIRMSDIEPGDTRIIFVSQKRSYFKTSTVSKFGMKLSSWLKILSLGDIIPEAVEILHENNGGWGVHTSDCSDVNDKSCTTKHSGAPQKTQACAYHIWFKARAWWNEEHFVYARHDFHSGKNFLLVAGSSIDSQVQRLLARFSSVKPQPHLFSILLTLVTTWTKDLEHFLWDQDFATQRLESDTGWSTVGHTQLKPLPREKLAVRRDLVITKDSLSHVVRASESFSELFNFLSQKTHSLPAIDPSGSRPDQLQDAFLQYGVRQWHQRQQANALMDRIDAQWNAVTALVAQHNNGLNYQIASDSRTDTIIMRRISFVTITFLPATFLATFFSMTFFDLSLGRITVSPMIWIYFVCTIPVTLAIAWQYSTMEFSTLWRGKETTFPEPSFEKARQRRAPLQSEMQQLA